MEGSKSPRSKATPSSHPPQHNGEKKISEMIQEKSIRTSPLPLWTGYREPASEVRRSLGCCHIERPQMLPRSPVGARCLQQSCWWASLRAVGLQGRVARGGEEMPMGNRQGKLIHASREGLCPVSASRAFHLRS